MLKGDTDKGSWENYLDHIGLFFIFTACAGISIIVWIFNWICWINNCCCCDFLHNPVNKRIAWWMSFSFLLGILACCVSAFVSANRFGFALEGAWCAVDRIYYDSLYGQLKTSEPKWEGMENVTTISNNLAEFYGFITGNSFKWNDFIGTWEFDDSANNNYWKPKESTDEDEEKYQLQTTRFNIIINSLARLIKFKPSPTEGKTKLNELLSNDFTKIKSTFLDDHFYYYTKTLKACLKILAMIYYSFLLTAITAAGVSMMFYACLKRQGYLLTFMHVLWNVIRFFMFSFFLYGTAYGIGFLAIRDSIAYLMYVFGEENLAQDAETKLIDGGKNFFSKCLIENDSNLKNVFDQIYTTSLSDFFYNYYEIINNNTKYGNIQTHLKNISDTYASGNATKNSIFFSLVNRAGKEGGLFGSFDCGFLKSNLNLLYTALYDASVESRILCAVSLCSSFFGAVAVYFFLLVMHHYNNELFFDTGKSIFTGFDGFGGGYKKKNNNQDPAFKKRKLRAEIELTSKNEDNDVKNNEEEED
jgi:hypothetical protein